MVHVDMVVDGLGASGDVGFGALMVQVLHGRQAVAGARRRHRHRAEAGFIDAGAGGTRMGAGGIGAGGMADGLFTRVAAVEMAIGGLARNAAAVADGLVGGCRAVEDAVSHQDLLELLVFFPEDVVGLNGVAVGHLGAGKLFFDGADVDFFALAVGARSAISIGDARSLAY